MTSPSSPHASPPLPPHSSAATGRSQAPPSPARGRILPQAEGRIIRLGDNDRADCLLLDRLALGGLSLAVAAGGILLSSQFGVDTFLIRGFDPLEDAVEYGRSLLPATRAAVAARGMRTAAE